VASLLQRGHRRFLSIQWCCLWRPPSWWQSSPFPVRHSAGQAPTQRPVRRSARGRHHHELAPIGIVSAEGSEQAPILAEMKVQRSVEIDGYTFWIGTIAGRSVVDHGIGRG